MLATIQLPASGRSSPCLPAGNRTPALPRCRSSALCADAMVSTMTSRTSSPSVAPWSSTRCASRLGSVRCRASSSPVSTDEQRRELVRGCYTIVKELNGLDFNRQEIKLYFQFASKPPKGFPRDLDMARPRAAIAGVLAASGAEPPTAAPGDDAEGLKAAQAMLSDIWRWRRRGGGMDEESEARPHQQALLDLQNFKEEDIDRITSSVLDNLDLSDAQKKEMSGSMQQVAVAGFNSAVWGSLVAGIGLLLLFNFGRAG